MARVVCQMLVRPDRLTFLWSEGPASFEPYHQTGTNLQELRGAARRAAELLRELAAAPASGLAEAGAALARAGHELYQQLFRADGAGAEVAQEVRGWLAGLEQDAALERLEMIGDAEELPPWEAVHDSPPDDDSFRLGADTPQAWGGFWGARLDLVSGPRVNPLRSRPVLESPVSLLLIDPVTRAALSEEGQERLRAFAQGNGLAVVESAAALADAVKAGRPDVLYALCRVSGHALLVGDDRLFAGELRETLRAEARGPATRGDTFLFLNACQGPGGEPGADVLDLVSALGMRASLAPRAPLPPEAANRFGVELLTGLLGAGQRLGQALQRARAGELPLGLLYVAQAPAGLRVVQRPPEQGESTAVRAEGGAAPPAERPAPAEGEARTSALSLPETPYFPLAAYDAADRALFVGREDDADALGEALDEPGVRLVLLHGQSAVGKGSLLRAGLVPLLEDDSVGYRILRDRSGEDEGAAEGGEAAAAEEPDEQPGEDDFPILLVRTTGDLAGQLALTLCDYCARPYRWTTPTGRAVEVDLPGILVGAVGAPPRAPETAIKEPDADVKEPGAGAPPLPRAAEVETVRTALRRDPWLLGRLLAELAERLPHEVVLLLEQGEELFTLTEGLERGAGPRAVAMLRRLADTPGRARVVLSLRTDYQGRLLGLLQQGPEDLAWLRSHRLEPLDEQALLNAVQAPTSIEPLAGMSEAPFVKYRFLYEGGLAEQLVRTARRAAAARQQSAAALLQVVCARLAARAQGRPDNVVRQADVARIGGVEEGLVRDFQQRLRSLALPGGDRALFRAVLDRLVLRTADGTAVRDLVAEDKLAQEWKGIRPLPEVLEAAAEARLVELQWLDVGGGVGRYVSLGHDALVPVVERESEESTRYRYGRSRMADTLWIMIPLIILVAAWGFNRTLAVWSRDKALKTLEDTAKGLQTDGREWMAEAKHSRWPVYAGFISRAQQAAEAGDLLSARQHLLGLQLTDQDRKKFGGQSPVYEPGFEWYYLWARLDGSRQTLLGHPAPVTAVAVAPDGKALASASADGAIKLWGADTGLIRADLERQGGAVHALAFSKNGLLASAGADGVVRLWDSTAGAKGDYVKGAKPLQALPGHKGAVLALAFAPDGKTLASGGRDGTVRFWDVPAKEKAKERGSVTEHKGPVNALAYTPDGKTLASGGEDGAVKFWDVAATGKEKVRRALKGSHGAVRALACSADGKLLAVGTEANRDGFELAEVRLWKPATGKALATLETPLTGVFGLAFAGGNTLAVAGKDGALRLWDVDSERPGLVLRGHLGWVRAVAATPDGKTLVTGSEDATVKLWDTAGPSARDVLQGHTGWVNAVAFSPDDKNVASGGADGTVKVWVAATGKERATLKGHTGGVLAVAYSPDCKRLASAGADGTVRLWDVDPKAAKFGAELGTFKGHQGPVQALAFAASGKEVTTGGADGTVRTWGADPARKESFGKDQLQPVRHPGGVRAVVYLYLKDAYLLSAGDDKVIHILDLTKRRQPVQLRGHTAAVLALAVWPEAPMLASAGADQTVRFWDMKEDKYIGTVRGHSGSVSAVAFGRGLPPLLVSGGADGVVCLWNPFQELLAMRFTMTGHNGPVQAVAVSSDQQLIASAGRDGRVRLWRAPRPASLRPPQHPGDEGE
jgi:WD40 repeat protein